MQVYHKFKEKHIKNLAKTNKQQSEPLDYQH